jgi:anti-sigma-K factor RskA
MDMNIQEYIESGIIENYVLGATTAGESAEVERMALEYPDIQTEIEAIRTSLENYAIQYEKEPPAFLKEKIMAGLFSGQSAVGSQQSAIRGQQSTSEDNGDREIVPLNNSSPQRSIFRMAASWALLALSVGANIWFFRNWKNSEEKLVALESQNQILAKEGQTLKASYNEEVAILQNPDFKVIKLLGQKDSPSSTAMVYFDKKQQSVYLSSLNLPQAPTGKQYQLWAFVDGKPVDAGLIDQNGSILKMKQFAKAEMFAISLEVKGGSTTEAGPKGTVYVVGAV